MRMKTYMFLGKTYAKKYAADAKDAIKTLGAKIKSKSKAIKPAIEKYGNIAEKHIKKHKIKYTAGTAATAGYSFANIKSDQEKKLKKHFANLPKSDPRYKALKKKGYV